MISRERIRMIGWGLIALTIVLGSFHAFAGLVELKFRLDGVRTEARVSDVSPGPEWIVAFQWHGELHTARTDRLAGSPREGDRITVMTDPDDSSVAVSPGMSLQDWSDLPGLLAVHTFFLVAAILILRLVRPEDEETPARPIPRPRGPSARRRRNRRPR